MNLTVTWMNGEVYAERLQQHFVVNQVEDVKIKIAILIFLSISALY